MIVNLGFLDEYPRLLHEELMRESAKVRLADLATGHRRPFRRRVADWLVATAEWVEGSSSRRIVHALER
jgi:hypothetical protein